MKAEDLKKLGAKLVQEADKPQADYQKLLGELMAQLMVHSTQANMDLRKTIESGLKAASQHTRKKFTIEHEVIYQRKETLPGYRPINKLRTTVIVDEEV